MLSIIDTSTKRCIEIYNLLCGKKEKISIKKLSNETSISEYILRRDLSAISKVVGKPIVKDNMICLGEIQEREIILVNTNLILESIPIKFILKLLKEPNYEVCFYADKIHVSISSIYRYISSINHALKNYDIEIQNNTSKYSFVGVTEFRCRLFFTEFLFELYGDDNFSLFNEELFLFFKKRVKKIFYENDEFISEIQLVTSSIFYYLSIIREEQGFILEKSNFLNHQNILMEEEEKQFIKKRFHISMDKIYTIENFIYTRRYRMSYISDEKLEAATFLFLKKIYSEFNVSISHDEEKKLIKEVVDVCYSSKYFKIPFDLLNDRFSWFYSKMQAEYNTLFITLKKLLKELSTDAETDLKKYDSYLIYLLVTTFPDILKTEIFDSFLFISSYSKNHSVFLAKYIQSKLSNDKIFLENVECISEENLINSSLEKFSVIIANCDLSSYIYDDELKFISINDYPSDKNIEEIKQEITKITS